MSTNTPTQQNTAEERDVVLRVDGMTKQFAGLTALNDVSLKIHDEEIVGLIGPNGAGKTTLFNCISGTFPPTDGTVELDGEDITALEAHEVAKRGLARTFQVTRPLADLTVLENVMVGAHINTKRRSEAETIAREKLAFVGLADREQEKAEDLTVGDQKRLELARTIATQPDVLLLDEIMAGLTPAETEQMLDLFRELRADGMSILI
ncbi:MAG: ABC transporter ATP-binding protein, partial [Halanaeroarchaeum sp.]